MRVERRPGLALVTKVYVLIGFIAFIGVSYYLLDASTPKTLGDITSTGSGASTSSNSTSTASAVPVTGFIASQVSCGFGMQFGGVGVEGCIANVYNNSTTTFTTTGTCTLIYGNESYTGTFLFQGQIAPGPSHGLVRKSCGTTSGPPAGAGVEITEIVSLTNNSYFSFTGTSQS